MTENMVERLSRLKRNSFFKPICKSVPRLTKNYGEMTLAKTWQLIDRFNTDSGISFDPVLYVACLRNEQIFTDPFGRQSILIDISPCFRVDSCDVVTEENSQDNDFWLK